MIIMMIIIWNSIMLALDDPTTDYEPYYIVVMNGIFLSLYTLEMALKVIGNVNILSNIILGIYI